MTYMDMVKEVILTQRSPKGISLQAIKKGVQELKGETFNQKLVTSALNQGVEAGIFTRADGQHYKITPDQRKGLKKESPKKKGSSPSPKKSPKKKSSKPAKKSTAPKATKPKKSKTKSGPSAAAKKKATKK